MNDLRQEIESLAEEWEAMGIPWPRDCARHLRNILTRCAPKAEAERDALAAAMPSEGADASLAYAAMKTDRDSWKFAAQDAAKNLRDALAERDNYHRQWDGLAVRIGDLNAERNILLNKLEEANLENGRLLSDRVAFAKMLNESERERAKKAEVERDFILSNLNKLAHEWEYFPRGDSATDASYAYAKEDCATALLATLSVKP